MVHSRPSYEYTHPFHRAQQTQIKVSGDIDRPTTIVHQSLLFHRRLHNRISNIVECFWVGFKCSARTRTRNRIQMQKKVLLGWSLSWKIDGTRPWMVMMQSSRNILNPLVSWIPYPAPASYHVICATRGVLIFETLIHLTDQGICKKAIPMHCREGMRNGFTSGTYSIVWPTCEVLMQIGRISFLSTCLVFPSYFSGALRTPRIWTLLCSTDASSCHRR